MLVHGAIDAKILGLARFVPVAIVLLKNMQVLEKFLSIGKQALQEIPSIQWKNWAVHVIKAGVSSPYGLLFWASVAVGAVAARLIDSSFPLEEGYPFKEYSTRISMVKRGIPAVAAAFLIPASLSRALAIQNTAIFSVLTAGLLVGIKGYEYFSNQALRKFNQYFESFKRQRHPFYGVPERLSFKGYADELKDLDLRKLSKKIGEEAGGWVPPTILDLYALDLTDDTLKQLGDAPWFKKVETLFLSHNSKITVEGLKWVGENGFPHLKSLGIAGMNLTDDDLKQLAESGHFIHLEWLGIGSNPKLTGKGMRWIGTGCPNLKVLFVCSNPQVLSQHLDEWIGCDGFKHLDSLDLRKTNLTSAILEKMIEQAKWIRRLKGFDISYNSTLTHLPSNIWSLMLEKPGSPGEAAIYNGRGLYCRGCSDSLYDDPVFIAFMKSGKIFPDRPLSRQQISHSFHSTSNTVLG